MTNPRAPEAGVEQGTARWISAASVLVPLLGVALHAHIAARAWNGEGSTLFVLGLFASSTLPYALCLLIGRRNKPLHAAVAAVFCLAFDLFIYVSVFIAPASSTAALARAWSGATARLPCMD